MVSRRDYVLHPTQSSLIRLEWTDREALTLALDPKAAGEMASVILVQDQNPPPKRDRLS